MLDARREAVLAWPRNQNDWEDHTRKTRSYRESASHVQVTYKDNKTFNYGRGKRGVVVRGLQRHSYAQGERLEVNGKVWGGTPEMYKFQAVGRTWWRIFWNSGGTETYQTYQDSQVRLVRNAAAAPRPASILAYFRDLVKHLADKDDPLIPAFQKLDFVHPESALARYLNPEPFTQTDWDAPIIFPFSCNLSQRLAVRNALRNPVSVIDGPPGTGKTQTILNLVANLVGSSKTVGIVSLNNAAVDNVGDKLTAEGFGHLLAILGRHERTKTFFQPRAQSERRQEIERLRAEPPVPMPTPEQITELDRRLERLQDTERTAAELRTKIDEHELQLWHFRRYVDEDELPDLEHLSLLRKPSGRIIDFLVDIEADRIEPSRARKFVRRIKGYFVYGSTRRIDPDDAATILRLQQAYYERELVDLRRQLSACEAELARADFVGLAEQHRQLSIQAFRAGLQQHYADLTPRSFSSENYRRYLQDFLRQFPVMLSTCHSLRNNLDGQLLDYVIIDEASQAHLLAATLALSCARNVVVVGDLRQLPQIAEQQACDQSMPAPTEAYDYGKQNILSSLIELFGDRLPRTMLREHYRCHPEIIGFCNRKFYAGNLIPYTRTDSAGPAARPLLVHRTAEGNHMRQHRTGARTNQRELDAITGELITKLARDGVAMQDIGVTTPYRGQANKATDILDSDIQADTVHKFQGREKPYVIMSTVLDETRAGASGLRFVDDPQLVNVAVSRAVRQFILVIHHNLLPRSRYIRDLIDYIRYHDPSEPIVTSQVVSIFDLLYEEYSSRLEPIARRIQGKMKHRSEEIASIVLGDILSEQPYQGLRMVSQVWLRNLLPGVENLTAEQRRFVRHPNTSVDFVIYNGVTLAPVLAVEVDGFAFHENRPDQLVRDAHKDAICETYGLPLLRLPTTGSREQEKIRRTLDRLLENGPRTTPG